jgi:hypothetical protein
MLRQRQPEPAPLEDRQRPTMVVSSERQADPSAWGERKSCRQTRRHPVLLKAIAELSDIRSDME